MHGFQNDRSALVGKEFCLAACEIVSKLETNRPKLPPSYRSPTHSLECI